MLSLGARHARVDSSSTIPRGASPATAVRSLEATASRRRRRKPPTTVKPMSSPLRRPFVPIRSPVIAAAGSGSGGDEEDPSAIDDEVESERDDAIATGSMVSSTSTSASATSSLASFSPSPSDPLRPWEADVPTLDEMSRPDWPSRVRDWPRFWAVYEAWRAHLARRSSSPPKRDVRAQPRKRPTAAWERALRLAPPDGGEEEAVPRRASTGDGAEDGDGGGEAVAAPPVLTGKEWWSLAAATSDVAVARAVEAVHRSLPLLLAAKVPVPETLDPLDPWKDEEDAVGLVEGLGGEETSGGFDLRWRESRDPSALPTYAGSNGSPGPRSPTGQQLAASSLTAKEAAEASGVAGEGTGASGSGVVRHAWSTWGDVELRAWSEKRRAHERAERRFAARQALVGKHKAFNVDETTDVRMRRKVAGLPHFKVEWTHDEIMGVITNRGENVHPDAASPALGVGDPEKKLDYWEEGVHAAPDIVDVIAAAGRLADADSLPDVVAAAAAAAASASGGATAALVESSRGDDAGVKSAATTTRASSSASAPSATARASSARSSSVSLPPSSVAASATLSETFEGLDVDVDEEMGDSDGDDIGGVPGLDVDPDDDD